jgi:hypothetical protein
VQRVADILKRALEEVEREWRGGAPGEPGKEV